MGDEVEAGANRVCDRLQRPDHPDRELTNANVRSAVNQTVPRRCNSFEDFFLEFNKEFVTTFLIRK